jgi:hypothetical protein
MSTPNRISFRSYQTNALGFVLALISCFSLNAQIVDLSQGEALQELPYFNEEWIHENRISTIRSIVAIKDDGQPIKKRRTQVTYRFHRDGKFQSMYRIIDKGSWIDSASISVRYSSNNQIVSKRERDLFGVHLYSYEYRDDGSLFREVYSRPSAYNMKAKSVFYEDQFFDDGTLKRIHRNKNDRAFKDELFQYNSLNQPTNYREKRHITGLYLEKRWCYDSLGLLDSLIVIKHQPSRIEWTYNYQYDDTRNLISYDVLKAGTLVSHHELLYRNDLLDTILSRDEETHRITITRFTYEFF